MITKKLRLLSTLLLFVKFIVTRTRAYRTQSSDMLSHDRMLQESNRITRVPFRLKNGRLWHLFTPRLNL